MKTLSTHSQSIIFGLLGVVGFSLTLPATRLAVTELDPTFVGLGRAIIAAAIAGIALAMAHATRPVGMQWLRLCGTAIGVVIGFPLLSTWAMTTVPAAHGAVVVGLLPLSTALFGAWLAGERPRPLFWASTIVGSVTIAFFSLSSGGGSFHTGDFLLLGAVIAAGFGYAAFQENSVRGKQSVGHLLYQRQCCYFLLLRPCRMTLPRSVGKACVDSPTSA